MASLINRIVRIITDCDESLRMILTTAALVAMIMGGIALHNFFGGVLVGMGIGVVTLSLFGVIYEQYSEELRENGKNVNNSG